MLGQAQQLAEGLLGAVVSQLPSGDEQAQTSHQLVDDRRQLLDGHQRVRREVVRAELREDVVDQRQHDVERVPDGQHELVQVGHAVGLLQKRRRALNQRQGLVQRNAELDVRARSPHQRVETVAEVLRQPWEPEGRDDGRLWTRRRDVAVEEEQQQRDFDIVDGVGVQHRLYDPVVAVERLAAQLGGLLPALGADATLGQEAEQEDVIFQLEAQLRLLQVRMLRRL